MDIASLYTRAFPAPLGRILAPLGLAGVAVVAAPGFLAAHRHAKYWARVARHAAAMGHPQAIAAASPWSAYIELALPAVAAAIIVIYLCSRGAGRHLIRESILPFGETQAEGEPRPSFFFRAWPSRWRRIIAAIWTGAIFANAAATIHFLTSGLARVGPGAGYQRAISLTLAETVVIWVAGLILLAAGWHPTGEPGVDRPRRPWLRVREDRR